MRKIVFIALALLLGQCVWAGDQARLPDEITHLAESWAQHDKPGFALGILKDGEVLYAGGFGSANLEHKVPITADTVFDVASVSKQFAGMAIALLVLDGKLELEDDIRKYLPDIADFGHTITVEQLLHHTSGVRDWVGLMLISGMSMQDTLTFEQIMRMAHQQRELSFEPGSDSSYSNTGYNLLARIVEVVSGQSFSDWTKENIFAPLKMKQSYFPARNGMVVANRADSYEIGPNGQYLRAGNRLTALGSSSLHTTVNDLLKWLENFETHTVGGVRAYEMMQQPAVLNDGTEQPYGFGIAIQPWNDQPVLSHGGSWAGFRTWLAYFPDSRLGIVVLGNSADFNSSQTGTAVARAMLGMPNEAPVAGADDKRQAEGSTLSNHQDLNDFVGHYRMDALGLVVSVILENEMLSLTILDRQALSPVSEDRFVSAAGGEIRFVRQESGEVIEIEGSFFGNEFIGKRVASAVDADTAAELVGDFYNPELDITYSVSSRGNELVAHHWRSGEIRLFRISDDQFATNAWYMSGIQIDRNIDGKVIGFSSSAMRNQNVRFLKR